MRDPKEIKLKIIEAGHQAVEQLIKVAKEAIIKPEDESELSADRLKNAAATKKLAIFDAFEILNRIESEREALEMLDKGVNRTDTKQGFAAKVYIESLRIMSPRTLLVKRIAEGHGCTATTSSTTWWSYLRLDKSER